MLKTAIVRKYTQNIEKTYIFARKTLDIPGEGSSIVGVSRLLYFQAY